MSEFSQLFSDYVHAKDIKIYSMAAYCGMDRSTMYKILRGKRTPSSEEMVKKIAGFMQLTPLEQNSLLESFRITVTGRSNYYRRKDVFHFLSTFTSEPDPLIPRQTGASPMDFSESVVPLCGESHISGVLLNIAALEAKTENGYIRMLVQPDFTSFFEQLNHIILKKDALTIEHIMCFNNNPEIPNSKRDYNLHCLKSILPLYTAGCRYHPYYYYDNIISRLDSFHLFPYMMLTSQYAVTFSEDMSNGILYSRKDILDFLSEIYSAYLEQAPPMLRGMGDVFGQLNYIQSLCSELKTPEYSFQMIPCLTPFFTRELVTRCLSHHIPERDRFIDLFCHYASERYRSFAATHPVFICSEDGIRHFLETGRMEEYPYDIYSPPEMSDRIFMITRLLESLDTIRLRLLRENIGNVTHGISVYVNSNAGYIQFSLSDGTIVYLDIEESSLLNTFRDFFENMDDSMFYSEKEIPERLRMLIKEFS